MGRLQEWREKQRAKLIAKREEEGDSDQVTDQVEQEKWKLAGEQKPLPPMIYCLRPLRRGNRQTISVWTQQVDLTTPRLFNDLDIELQSDGLDLAYT